MELKARASKKPQKSMTRKHETHVFEKALLPERRKKKDRTPAPACFEKFVYTAPVLYFYISEKELFHSLPPLQIEKSVKTVLEKFSDSLEPTPQVILHHYHNSVCPVQ